MKKRRTYTRDLKIAVIRELENGKTPAQVSRENSIHPTMLQRWKREYKEDPQAAFGSNGNISKLNAKVVEYERIIGRLHAENEFLKKALTGLEIKVREYKKLK